MAGEPLPPVVQEFIANVEPWVTALESAAESSQVMVEAAAKVSASAQEMSTALNAAAGEVSAAYAKIDEAAGTGTTGLDAADAKVTAGAEEMATATDAAVVKVEASYAKLGTAGNASAAGLEAADAKVTAGADEMATATSAAVTKVEESYAKLGTTANAGAAELEAADAKITAGADETTAATTKVAGSVDAVAAAQAKLTAEQAKLQAATDAQIAAQKELIAANEQVAAGAAGAAEAQAAALAKVESADKAAASASKDVTAAQTEAGAASEGMGSKVKTAALGLGIASVAAVKMAGDFQQMTERLVTGAGESASNLKMVQSGILQLSVSTNTSAKQLSDGMFMIESAGFHAQNGLNVLKAAAEGAKAENANLSDVSRALTVVMNDFGKSVGTPTQAMNALIAIESHGQVTMQELASSLHTSATAASSAKISLGELGGATATLTAQGMSARQAALDLAHVITSLENPTAVQSKEMQALGLNSNDVSQKLGQRGLTGTFSLLAQTVLTKMGPSGQVLLNTFNTSKVASQDLKTMMDAMPPSVRKLADELLHNSISAGDYAKAAKALPPIQQGMAAQFETTAKNAEGFNSALKAGVPGTQTFQAAIAKMTGGQMGLQVATKLTGDHLGMFQSNVAGVSAAAKKGGSDVENWAMIQDQFNNKLGSAEKAAKAVAITWGTALLPAATAAATAVADLGKWLAQNQPVAIALAAVIGGVLSIAIGGKMVKSVQDGIQAFKDLGKSVNDLIDKILGVKAPTDAAAAATEASTTATEASTTATEATTAAKTASATATEATTTATTAATAATEATTTATEATTVATTASATATEAATVAKEATTVATTAATVATEAGAVAEGEATAATTALTVATEAETVAEGEATVAAGALDVALSPIILTVGAIVIGIGLLVAAIVILWNNSSSFRDFWKGVWADIQSAVDTVVTFIENRFQDLVNRFNWVVTTIQQAFQNLPAAMQTIGVNIINAILGGIESAVAPLINYVNQLATSIYNTIKSALGIASPSRVFHEVGENIVQGLCDGMRYREREAYGFMRQFGQNLQTSFSAGPNLVNRFTGTSVSSYPGLGSATGAAGTSGGGNVIQNFNIQGSVVAETQLRQLAQQGVLRYTRRNPGNGWFLAGRQS